MKTQILTQSLTARIEEVLLYQINADNYTRAIEKIGDDDALQEFKNQLEENLKTTLHEQRKAQIMLDVVKDQLEEMDVSTT
jgi:hypothetical protein